MFSIVKIEALREIELLITRRIEEILSELENKKDDDFNVASNLINKCVVLNNELIDIRLKIEKARQNRKLDSLVEELEDKYIFSNNRR